MRRRDIVSYRRISNRDNAPVATVLHRLALYVRVADVPHCMARAEQRTLCGVSHQVDAWSAVLYALRVALRVDVELGVLADFVRDFLACPKNIFDV